MDVILDTPDTGDFHRDEASEQTLEDDRSHFWLVETRKRGILGFVMAGGAHSRLQPVLEARRTIR